MRQLTISMMRTMGFKNILVVNSNAQCLEIIAINKIDLIVCGWALPRLDALSILKTVRTTKKSISIPFVIISTIIEQEQI